MQISSIVVIVHPFWQLFKDFELLFPRGSNFILSEKLTKEQKLFVKNRLHNFGQIVNGAKNDPNKLVAIVKPEVWRADTELSSKYSSFLKYAEKQLGERLVYLPAALGFGADGGSKKQLSRAIEEGIKSTENNLNRFNFNSKVKVELTGEYSDQCVKKVQNRLIRHYLKDRALLKWHLK